jgi:hypothetical protein
MRTLVLAAILLSSVTALAAPGGTIYVLPDAIDLKEADYEAKAKKDSIKTVENRDGRWTMFVLAWLKRTPGGKNVEVAFFDKAKKRPDPDSSIVVGTQPSAKVFATLVNIADDAGLEAGHTYEMRIKKPGPKGETLASTIIETKK